jgi:enoyl-CoA hydratase/carnithine racemase
MTPPSGRPAGVRLEHDGPVVTVMLCRPEALNAQTPETWTQLREYGRTLTGEVRVVVVRGEGRAFSAGLDLTFANSSDGPDSLRAIATMPPEEAQERIAAYQEGFSWLRRPDLVSIAAVQGHAIGAGFQLALACDLRVAADDAEFTMGEVALGLVPDLGGTKRLVELVGYARAMEICLTGRRVPAAEAERIGIANLVVPVDQLASATDDLAAAVLAAPRNAVIEIKALLAAAAGRDFAAQEAAERAAQVRRIRDLADLGD